MCACRRCCQQCCALVHHGGIGSTAEALRAAVAQLVQPWAWAFDQFNNAQRVVALGLGLTLWSRRQRAGRLQRALRQELGAPALTAACRAWAAQLAVEPGPDALCRQLLPVPAWVAN